MRTPVSSLRSRLARVILVAAMMSLVALFATAARAQVTTDTATDTPVTPTAQDDDSDVRPTTQANNETDAEPVRLPNTGGNLAALALAGITIAEVGAGLMLLAGRRRRS